MEPRPAYLNPNAVERAAQLAEQYEDQALAAAKAGLQASTMTEDIDLWSAVCAILVTSDRLTSGL